MKRLGLLAAALLFTGAVWGQNPTAADVFHRAMAAQQRGDLDSAIRGYQQALKLSPGLTAAHVNLAAAFMQQNDLDRALGEYQIAHQQSPTDVKIAVLLGNCYMLRGEQARIVPLLTPFEKKYPNDLDLAFILGDALIYEGKFQDGIKLVQRVAAERNDASAWMLLGMTQLKLGEDAKARESLDRGIRIDPNVPGAYTFSGMAKSLSGDEQGAKESFRQALRQDPDDFEANLHLGTILRREGDDLESARRLIAHCLQLRPESLAAHYQMAQVESATGDIAGAAAELEAVVRQVPNELEPHVQLSGLYYRLHRSEDGKREREIVDRLMAQPAEQQHQLEDRTLGPEKDSANGSVPSP